MNAETHYSVIAICANCKQERILEIQKGITVDTFVQAKDFNEKCWWCGTTQDWGWKVKKT